MDMMDSSDANNNQNTGFLANLRANPNRFALAVFLVGLIIGWIVFGWFVWPVDFTGSPADMHFEDQKEYVRMVIDSYNLRTDLNKALARLDRLGESKESVWNAVAAETTVEDPTSFAIVHQILGPLVMQGAPVGLTPAVGTTPGAPTDDTGEGGSSQTFLLVACAFTFIVGGVLVLLYFRKRDSSLVKAGEEGTVVAAIQQAAAITREAQDQQTDYSALGGDPPIAQWMTTYLIGDDLFDDSFSIDAPSGEFMGECGVGIADTVGVGEPKRVSAFEVWLFDKNDIQTVTKVVMSANTASDEASLNRLAAKGEPMQAMVGEEIVLETQTLQLIVRIVDMAYGEGSIPERSHFDRATMELAVWAKV